MENGKNQTSSTKYTVTVTHFTCPERNPNVLSIQEAFVHFYVIFYTVLTLISLLQNFFGDNQMTSGLLGRFMSEGTKLMLSLYHLCLYHSCWSSGKIYLEKIAL